MATRTTPAVDAGIMPDFAQAGVVLCRSLDWSTDKQIQSSETLQLLPIPKDALLLDFAIQLSTQSTRADIGYDENPDMIFSDVSLTCMDWKRMGSSGGVGPDQVGMLAKFTADDTIDIYVSTSALESGTRIRAWAMYKMSGTIADEGDPPGI